MERRTSVIIPGYNESDNIKQLARALEKQTCKPKEILFIDDGSTDNTIDLASRYFKVIQLKKNNGPGCARNRGMAAADGEFFGFLDADVIPHPDWIYQIEKNLSRKGIKAIVGDAHIPKSTFLGDSISALGFPGGGHLGSDKIWKVEKDGAMNHIGGLNFAIRREIYTIYGGFDERFTFNCEDADYANYLWHQGVRILYVPDLIVTHKPILPLKRFIQWHIKRGEGNFIFKQKVGNISSFIKLRLWSSWNIVKAYYKDIKFPLILMLLLLSFVAQQTGYVKAKIMKHRAI
jgi:glycosyltransferase involved in cell wall biosynthesis